jgi:hypothetical protein
LLTDVLMKLKSLLMKRWRGGGEQQFLSLSVVAEFGTPNMFVWWLSVEFSIFDTYLDFALIGKKMRDILFSFLWESTC